jgi:hypothetical protein
MNHYQINEDGTAKVLAAMSKALNIPVVMTPDTKAQGLEVERDDIELNTDKRRIVAVQHDEGVNFYAK